MYTYVFGFVALTLDLQLTSCIYLSLGVCVQNPIVYLPHRHCCLVLPSLSRQVCCVRIHHRFSTYCHQGRTGLSCGEQV